MMESTTRITGIDGEVRRVLPGEPYAPLGRRIVFTSWYWVRAGGFEWHDAEGHGYPAITWQDAVGPLDASIRYTNEPRGIRIVAHPASRGEPLLQRERPWEAQGLSLSTVMRDGGIYRAWGPCESASRTRFMAYYESDDGREWRRPTLGIAEFEGDRDTNLIGLSPREGGSSLWGWTIFKDPAGPASERYKALKEDHIDFDEVRAYRSRWPDDWLPTGFRRDFWYGIHGAVSSDGLHWTILPDPLVIEHSDTQPTAYFDAQLGRYVLYTRRHMIGPRSPSAAESWGVMSWGTSARRSIGRTESADFRHFPPSEIVVEPGPDMPPMHSLYTNGRTSIPQAPDHHLLFPAVYRQNDDITEIAILSSHDGKVWHYLPGPRVLETGSFGSWDGGCIFAHPELLELPDRSFALPYTGYIYPHKYPRGAWQFLPGYASWPGGRVVALEAPESGQFTTVGFEPPTRRIALNVRTKRAGRVLVEAASYPGGEPLPGRSFGDASPIVGDYESAAVHWGARDDLGSAENQAVMLRFRLEKAEIFAVDFV